MKRYGWMLFLLAGCGSHHHGPTVHERRAAIRASHERTYRSIDGFQSTRWGMTRNEVLALYPEAQETQRGDLVVSTTLGEQPARVFLIFTNGRLGSVFVRFEDVKDLRGDYELTVEMLTDKYDRPTKRGTSRRVQKYRESFDLAWLLARTSTPVPRASPAAAEPRPQVAEAPPSTVDARPQADAAQSQVTGEAPQVAQAQPGEAERQPPLVEAQGDGASPDDMDSEVPAASSPGAESEGRISRYRSVMISNWNTPEAAIRLAGYFSYRDKLLTIHYESHVYAQAIRDELAQLMEEYRREHARDF